MKDKKDLPLTESEIRIFHAMNHKGRFQDCVDCEEMLSGWC